MPASECELYTHEYEAAHKGESTPAAGFCDNAILKPMPPGGDWVKEPGGIGLLPSLRYRPSAPELRTANETHQRHRTEIYAGGRGIERAEARTALAALGHRTIVFIGDSNMRYQYLTLLAFLSSGGRWPPRHNGKGFTVCHERSIKPPVSVAWPLLHKAGGSQRLVDEWAWNAFFNQSSQSVSVDGAHEACDCHYELRNGAPPRVIENRFFELPHGTGSLRVAFLCLRNNVHMSRLPKHTWSAPNNNKQPRGPSSWAKLRKAANASVASQNYNVSSACARYTDGCSENMEGPDFVEKRLKPLKPDVLIWGPGPWVPIVHKDRENAKAFLQAMKAAVAPRNGRALFRTCPRGAVRMGGRRGCSNGAGCEDVYRSLLPEVGWELYDVFRLTEDLWKYIDRERGTSKTAAFLAFADNVHFHCDVYREWNRLLIRQMLLPASG